MDFDEYEYLEKAVEPAELPKDSNGTSSGRGSSKRRSDEDSYKRDERSKRSREHESERSEKADRSRSEREKSRDVERSERHRDRDRDRDYSDRDRRRSSRDIDRDYEKERDRDRGRSKDRRSHSRSRDYHTDRDRDRDREGSRVREEREHGVRDSDREYRHSREKREKKEEVAAEPEADPERDQRTVFAYQISLKADERDVYEFFSRAGKVRDVRLIMDRNSRRSKGVGYIEFYDAMSVPMAIALTGQPLLGQPVMVKPSEAEKNLVQSTTTASGTGGLMGPYSGGARRLYVRNLHPHITESQLRQVFEPFGVVEMVQLPTEPDTGNCKGFGFVQYAKLEDARAAQQSLNGTLEMAGRFIKVMAVTDQMSAQDAVVAPGELDDDDGGGLSLTARSRALLMQKLDRTGTVSSITAAAVAPVLNVLPTAPIVAPIVPGLGLTGMVGLPNSGLGAAPLGASAVEPIGAPTDCLLLKNMFDPRTETDPEFDLDIKDEVQSECSKFGVVKHIYVDKNSAGHVYLRFDSTKSAISAQKALHGRWFAGKMITTVFLTPQVYEGKFPDSK